MYAPRFNMKLVNFIKDILFTIHYGNPGNNHDEEFIRRLDRVDTSEVLLIVYELRYSNHGLTTKDVKSFFTYYERVFNKSLFAINNEFKSWHPVTLFIRENEALREATRKINHLIQEVDSITDPLTDEALILQLQSSIYKIGEFINHYNRKEKLIFPLLEKHGQFSLTRIMWAEDDRIRNLYKSTKSMMDRLNSLNFIYVKETFEHFYENFKEMFYQEETFLIPVIIDIFDEKDWLSIHEESNAFGFALVKPTEGANKKQTTSRNIDKELAAKQFPFGGGFLTLNEANTILNNLPVEITFVDKFGVFKYFNDMVEASEMIFVRTPSSIGRNVGNCHSPKSMKKVTQLIRDLQLRRREYECMWFKKDGKYVHITYKGLFDQDGEYLGILEYVQDIKPFLNLPKEVKKELKPLS